MSAIFGIYHREGKPLDTEEWHRIGRLTAFRGPDGTRSIQQENILLGCNSLYTTRESLGETLPLICKRSGCIITADARIDNREELIRLLELQPSPGSLISDSEIILAAYGRWSEGCFARLLGDFAIVIWDPNEQQLIAANDCMGVKPLFYFLSTDLFIFNTEIRPLVEHSAVSNEPNEGVVGEHLAGNNVNKTETLYKDVQVLSPGCYIKIGRDKVFQYRYWEPTFATRLRYSSDQQYIEHFLELFSEAVRCRLRSHLPVSAELSGGLDSSSIVGMSQLLAQTGLSEMVNMYSLIYPGFACDEQKYIREVEKFHQIPVEAIDGTKFHGNDWFGEVAQSSYLPDAPNLANSRPLLQDVQQKGSRVLLTGIGGDDWFTRQAYPYLDALRGLDFQYLREEFVAGFKKDWRRCVKICLANVVWPLFPYSLRRDILAQRGYGRYPEWVRQEYAETIGLKERLLLGAGELYVTDLANTDLYHNTNSSYLPVVLQVNDRQKARYGVEARHPFLDRRVVEFAFSLPIAMNLRHGIQKQLLRMAGKQYLPETIINRTSKAEFSELYRLAFATEQFQHVLTELARFPDEWIDRKILQEALWKNASCFKQKKSGPCRNTIYLWKAFAIILWYKNRV